MNDKVNMDIISSSPSGASAGLDKYITAMTDEEFDRQILQLRRLKAEKVRLSNELRNPETSLIKRLGPTLLGALSVSAHQYTNLEGDAIEAMEETVSRSYYVGKARHEFKIQGFCKAMSSYYYYEGRMWNCRVEAQYRGSSGKVFNEGCDSDINGGKLEYGGSGLLEILRLVAKDLTLGENVDLDTKLDLIRLFWGERFLDVKVMVRNKEGERVDSSFRDFLVGKAESPT